MNIRLDCRQQLGDVLVVGVVSDVGTWAYKGRWPVESVQQRIRSIERLTFEFPGKPPRPHLKEEGFNAIYMTNVANCWVRDVEFLEADNGINVTGVSRFLGGHLAERHLRLQHRTLAAAVPAVPAVLHARPRTRHRPRRT